MFKHGLCWLSREVWSWAARTLPEWGTSTTSKLKKYGPQMTLWRHEVLQKEKAGLHISRELHTVHWILTLCTQEKYLIDYFTFPVSGYYPDSSGARAVTPGSCSWCVQPLLLSNWSRLTSWSWAQDRGRVTLLAGQVFLYLRGLINTENWQ